VLVSAFVVSTAAAKMQASRAGLLVSTRLREDFGNGDHFYARAGEAIDLPEHRADRPNHDFLEWHLDEVFKAS
jgi:putative restriction endonuclease